MRPMARLESNGAPLTGIGIEPALVPAAGVNPLVGAYSAPKLSDRVPGHAFQLGL